MQDGHETERDGHCLECGVALDSRRKDAKWCCDAHRKRYTRRESRKDAQRQKYLSGHPDASLDDFYAFGDPGTWDNEDQDHEDHEPGNSWDDMWRVHEAIDAVERRYERRMKPYLSQQRRNPGVRLPGLVALERQRDQEIDAMIRAHELADELGRARRDEPRRLNEAHERQRERVALQALGNQLPGRARRTQAPNIGRATRDVWRWS
jgi:hypothetical protein